MSSKVWMVLSDCPSVWGCNVVLKCNLVHKAPCKLSQKWDVNLGSLSETIDNGTPCNLTISETYKIASLSNGSVYCIERKCADLVSLSTITQIALCFWKVWGNPIIKSTVIFSHFYSRIIKVWNLLAGAWYSAFTYWQVKHLATNSATSFLIVGH